MGCFLHQRCSAVAWTMRSSLLRAWSRQKKHCARDREHLLFTLEQRIRRESARLSACPYFRARHLGSTLSVHAATRHTRSSPAYGWRPRARSVRCVDASGTPFARRAASIGMNRRWCRAPTLSMAGGCRGPCLTRSLGERRRHNCSIQFRNRYSAASPSLRLRLTQRGPFAWPARPLRV